MSGQTSDEYQQRVEAWRSKRESALRAADGWLALCGLFPLQPGRQTIGSGAEHPIRLPAAAPAHLGWIDFAAGEAELTLTNPSLVLVDGEPPERAQIRLISNQARPDPTLVSIGTITFFVHTYGDQAAIRVRDAANLALRTFPGCAWFPIQPDYRVRGQFIPYDAPRALPIQTSLQTATSFHSVGRVTFALHGVPLSFAVADYGIPNQLNVIFRDQTAGQETYPAVRFLALDKTGPAEVSIDFNKAYNPPCAFTPYTTCPLPPRENILPVAIRAGEQYRAEHKAFYAQISQE